MSPAGLKKKWTEEGFRGKAINLKNTGNSVTEIVQILGRSRSTIYRCLKEGLDYIDKRRPKGRPKKLPTDIVSWLTSVCKSKSPITYGIKGLRWNSRKLSLLLKLEKGLEVSGRTIDRTFKK